MIKSFDGTPTGEGRLRIWTAPEWPLSHLGIAAPGVTTVEWVGRYGHPSGYGLLGGTLASTEAEVSQPELGRGPFPGNLAAEQAPVFFGLSQKAYWSAVAEAAPRLTLQVAAEGEVSSSAFVFYRLASMLVSLLADGIPASDEEVWTHWATATRLAVSWVEKARLERPR